MGHYTVDIVFKMALVYYIDCSLTQMELQYL